MTTPPTPISIDDMFDRDDVIERDVEDEEIARLTDDELSLLATGFPSITVAVRAAAEIVYLRDSYPAMIRLDVPEDDVNDASDASDANATPVRHSSLTIAQGDVREPEARPRLFVRFSFDPSDGARYETCATCGKHIRHHYGGLALGGATHLYRCDPRPHCDKCNSSFTCYDSSTRCCKRPDLPLPEAPVTLTDAGVPADCNCNPAARKEPFALSIGRGSLHLETCPTFIRHRTLVTA